MKKFFKIFAMVMGIIVIVGVAGFMYIKYNPPKAMITSAMDGSIAEQVKMQYDQPKTTDLKQELNFAPFKESLNAMSEEQYNKIHQLVEHATITDIQALYKDNTLKVEELVVYYLKRIEKYDVNKLNSVMELNREVIKLAREQDANKGTGKLYGIPVLLKGNVGTGDSMHTTAGAYALKDSVLSEDSFVVKQLKAEGALILGKTNLSEFANYMSSGSPNGYSTLGGQTHNAYGKFDVGGSSSGSAAAAAANFATVTIGTETSGSIIYPSSQNSVVGIKPSLGLVSRNRIIPITEAMDTAGVIARNVNDAAIALSVIAGSDKEDADTVGADQHKEDYTQYAKGTDLSQHKLLVLDLNLPRTGEEDIFKGIEKELTSMGAEVARDSLSFKELNSFDSSSVLTAGFKFDFEKYLKDASVNGVQSVQDVVKINNEDLANRAAYGQDLIEKSAQDTTNDEDFNRAVLKLRGNAASTIDKLLQDSGAEVIVSLSNELSSIYAGAGYPAITVPAGYKADGEPIGVTFVSTKFAENKLIQVASVYENHTKHRKSPQLQ